MVTTACTRARGHPQTRRMFGHCPTTVLTEMLRQANVDETYINAARSFRCETCAQVHSKTKAHPVAPPSPYTFNYNVVVDVSEVTDLENQRFSILSIVDQGTNYHEARIVSLGGQPQSAKRW